MARVLLDSTVLIDALRGRPAGNRLRALRREGDEPWTCAISIEEIWRPAKKPSHNGWCAACGVHRWARPKEVALDSGAGISPDDGSPFTKPTA